MRPFFAFTRVRTYDASCFLHGAQRKATFARSALGAPTTDARNNSSNAESMLQPAGYNATRRAVLLTVAFIGSLDPSSRIELGPVSYFCSSDAKVRYYPTNELEHGWPTRRTGFHSSSFPRSFIAIFSLETKPFRRDSAAYRLAHKDPSRHGSSPTRPTTGQDVSCTISLPFF